MTNNMQSQISEKLPKAIPPSREEAKKKAGDSSGNDTGGLEGMEDDPKASTIQGRETGGP